VIEIAQDVVRKQLVLFSVLGFFFFSSFGRCLPQAQPAQGSVIHVEVVGLRSEKGQVSCSLYSSAEGFPKEVQKAVAHVVAPISQQKAVCEFPGIAPGKYAVSVYHDENSNGKLDTNFLGIPREGVGASNNAKGHMGPPKFDSAKFQFAGGSLNLKITINYL
jgi:uncharacterized protein (DUF2141 family)